MTRRPHTHSTDEYIVNLPFRWYSVSEQYTDPYERNILTVQFTLPDSLHEEFNRETTTLSGQPSDDKIQAWLADQLHEVLHNDCITRAGSPTSCAINSVNDLANKFHEMQFIA